MNSKNAHPAIVETEKIASIFEKLPAPIVHNKRIAEILYAMMTRLPDLEGRYEQPHNLDILTCHDYAQASLLEKSLDYLGIRDYRVIRRPFSGPWRNTLKLKWVLEELESASNGRDHVLFCDADDAILAGDPNRIMGVFEAKKCGLLFMSTSFPGGYACMPEVKRWADTIRPGRYLNSGVYVGKREVVISVLREAAKYITDEDITAEESRQLGHGAFSNELCQRLPEYPKGSQDQDILRYIHPAFFPEMLIDFDNQLAFRNL